MAMGLQNILLAYQAKGEEEDVVQPANENLAAVQQRVEVVVPLVLKNLNNLHQF